MLYLLYYIYSLYLFMFLCFMLLPFLLLSDAKIQFFFDTPVFFFSHLPLHFHHSVKQLLLCGEIQLEFKSPSGLLGFGQSCAYMSIVLVETSLIATAVWTQLDMYDKKDVHFPAVLP